MCEITNVEQSNNYTSTFMIFLISNLLDLFDGTIVRCAEKCDYECEGKVYEENILRIPSR